MYGVYANESGVGIETERRRSLVSFSSSYEIYARRSRDDNMRAVASCRGDSLSRETIANFFSRGGIINGRDLSGDLFRVAEPSYARMLSTIHSNELQVLCPHAAAQ